MPQNKITILCTKNIDDASINDAALKNMTIDVLPFIRTEPISSKEIQAEIKRATQISATVIFTSVNAIETVAAEFEEQKPDWQVFCIGYATRRSAEKYFEKDLVAGTADNAGELAEIIINDAKPAKVIFFCGDQRRNELPGLLRDNNIEVKEIVVYQTITTPQKIEKNYDGILFFSPSAVKSFFQVNGLKDKTVLFAIGYTTADEIKSFSKNKVIVSDKPGKEILLEKAIRYFQTNPIHH